MEDLVASRIESISDEIGGLIKEREYKIQELREIEERLDRLTAVVFELKSLLDLKESTKKS